MKCSTKILPNGMTILTVPSQDAESVVVDFFIKTGSRSELPEENGISHFLEHFLFKGTKKYPSALEISQLIDGLGGEMNANTGKEHTQFFIKAHHRHLSTIFEVLTDMLINPIFDEQELEKEKGVVVEEINMYKDAPMYEIGNLLEKAMWPDEALGRSIAGEKETVVKFTPESFRSYMQRFYSPANIILGVSGKFNPKTLDSLVKKHWLPVKKTKFGAWHKSTDKQNSPRISLTEKATEQSHLALGFKGLNHKDKKNAVARVLSAILGGGMSSRLFSEVREKRGLAYYVRASSNNYHDTGAFEITAGVKVGSEKESIEIILDELRKVKDIKISEAELSKAKEYLKGRSVLALEDNQNRLEWYLDCLAFENKLETPKQVFEKIDSVTAGQVQKLAQSLFKSQTLTLATIGPEKDRKSFEKILEI